MLVFTSLQRLDGKSTAEEQVRCMCQRAKHIAS